MAAQKLTYQSEETPEIFWTIYKNGQAQKKNISSKNRVNYYPYGKTLRQFVSTDEKFLTTQHERDAETGLDYRGARFYDSDVARFLSLDPLAADYPSLSDYCYVAANPLSYIDPTGMSVEGNGELYAKTPSPVQVWGESIYSEEFNQLSVHEQNFLLHKWRSMEAGNTYKNLLGQAIEQGSSQAFYMGYIDQSGWWDSGAQRNWEMGARAWRPDGTGTFWMNAATYGIGGTLLAVTGATVMADLPAGAGAASINHLATTAAGGGIQSGGLNFLTQMNNNGWRIGDVDWTGVGSATITGILTGPGAKSLFIGSAGGAMGDALFDFSFNGGFATTFAPSDSKYYKSIGASGRDFAFGFVGNYMGGVSSISGSLGTLNPYTIIMETAVDHIAIGLNISFNATYANRK